MVRVRIILLNIAIDTSILPLVKFDRLASASGVIFLVVFVPYAVHVDACMLLFVLVPFRATVIEITFLVQSIVCYATTGCNQPLRVLIEESLLKGINIL